MKRFRDPWNKEIPFFNKTKTPTLKNLEKHGIRYDPLKDPQSIEFKLASVKRNFPIGYLVRFKDHQMNLYFPKGRFIDTYIVMDDEVLIILTPPTEEECKYAITKQPRRGGGVGYFLQTYLFSSTRSFSPSELILLKTNSDYLPRLPVIQEDF